MGKLYKNYLVGTVYVCRVCRAHLTTESLVMSTQFRGRTGRAFLFHNVVNVDVGPSEERTLTTGEHVVCDVYCRCCHTNIGWKYKSAEDPSQKYKEGKFCVERALMDVISDRPSSFAPRLVRPAEALR